ncbi:MAG: GIY-YIG nuclease family protein [Saprospiraceae bacterium]
MHTKVNISMKGWVYILLCHDGSYYTGSTNDLSIRILEHQDGKGANYTKNRLPVSLVYWEEFDRIDYAFNREKQLQGWTRKKKEALINRESSLLKRDSQCINDTHSKNMKDI